MILKNKTALVVGGSGGIGKAVCVSLAEAGADIGFVYNSSKESAEDIKNIIFSLNRKALMIQADISIYNSVKNMMNEYKKEFNSLDIIVNCAGLMGDSLIENMTPESWKRIIDINLTSSFYIVREAIGLLKNSPAGRIINLSSQAAFCGSKSHAHYSAAKSGILGLTYTMAKEFASYGITCNVISPGRVATRMLDYSSFQQKNKWTKSVPLNRLGTPKEISEVIVFLASEKSSYINGANINVNGGMLMG